MLFFLSLVLIYSLNLRPINVHSNHTEFFNPNSDSWNLCKMENRVSALSLLGPSDEEFKVAMSNVSIMVGSVTLGTLLFDWFKRHNQI